MAGVKKDVRLKEFWRKNERFADLFNAALFSGKEVIRPEDLQEMDTDMSGIISLKGEEQSLTRARDVVKKSAYGVDFVILGIENQQKIHYAMPLRTLLYDGLGYLKEYQETSQSTDEHGEVMTADEFLSRFRKSDRLHPIITLTIYYGEKEWDGPLSMRDMVSEMPKELEAVFADYKMNLVQVRESDKYIFNNEDVRTVFEITRSIYQEDFEGINQKYTDIRSELAAVVGTITDSPHLIEESSEKEVLNVCTAFEKLREEGKAEGKAEGREEGRAELILSVLKKHTETETAELLNVSIDEVKRAKSSVKK